MFSDAIAGATLQMQGNIRKAVKSSRSRMLISKEWASLMHPVHVQFCVMQLRRTLGLYEIRFCILRLFYVAVFLYTPALDR